jgi:Ras-related protein Rab-1A
MENSNLEEGEGITYKIMIIGDSSVGKTCLFKKLTTGKYSDKNISTIGIDRKTLSIKIKINENGEEVDKNFVIQLWDTAGQERFRSITKGYYKDSQGLLLIYDITNQETFDNVEKWIANIKDSLGEDDKENENKYIIILLGNKLDLAENGARKVTTELAEEKCQQFNIIWGGECSAKDSTVEELKGKFETYTREIYNIIGSSVGRNTIKVANNNTKEKSKCC